MPPQEPLETLKNPDDITNNDIDQSEWTMVEAALQIESFVTENLSLEKVKDYFFVNKKGKMNEKDYSFIQTVFVDRFFSSLPDKGRKFINEVISVADPGTIKKWIFVIYGNKSDEELLGLFQKSIFAETLEDMNQIIDGSKLSSFCQKMRTQFRIAFLNATSLKGMLGIYRCLLYCNAKTKRSKVFCDAVNSFWAKLFSDDEFINLKLEIEEAHIEHNLIEKLIKSFDVVDAKGYEFIIGEIKNMFEPIKFKRYDEDGDEILEICGRNIVWNEVSEQFYSKYDPSIIDQIRISAVQEIILNEDLKFPGKNLSLISPTINFPNKIICDLSGKNAIPNSKLEKPAKSGAQKGEDGDDGEDGVAGGSSGNLVISTAKIINNENLNVILNGGNGTKGQDGGNGAVGEDGIGAKFDDVFGFGNTLSTWYLSFSNTIYGGAIVRAFGGFTRTTLSNGITHVKSSSVYYWSTHLMEYYEGSKGKPGGQGGRNGNGGEGGKKGTSRILNQGEDQIKISKIQAIDGENGLSGKPGRTGEYGRDGWDVGRFRKTLGGWWEYGKNHNEKFEIQFTNVYCDDTIYVSARYTGNGSFCYARIVTKSCERQVLKENEKMAEKKSDAERKADAIARKTNAISLSSVEEQYEELCQAEAESAADQEQEMEEGEETEAQVNKIAEGFDIPKDSPYVSKERHIIPILSSEILNDVNIEDETKWESIWKATSSSAELFKLLQKAPKGKIEEKLNRKALLTTLRHNDRSSKGEFAKTVMKFLKSQCTTQESKLLDVLRRQRMAKNLQNQQRNCASFLKKAIDNDEIIDACVGALMGDSSYKNIIIDAATKLATEMLDVENYKKFIELLSALQKVTISRNPVNEHKLELETLFNGFKQTEADKTILANKLNEITKNVVLENTTLEKFNQMFKETCFDYILKDYSGLPKKVQTNETKILYFYIKVCEKVVSNQVLAEALKLIVRVQADEIQLDDNPHLFSEDALVITWLQIANDKTKYYQFIQRIIKFGTKCAAGRLLLAWETKVNLRIYNDGRLIEDHMPGIIGNVQHLEINEVTGEFTPLVFNSNQIILEQQRLEKAISFEKKLQELQKKYHCSDLLPQEFLPISIQGEAFNKQEEGKISLNRIGELKPKLENLLSFFESKAGIFLPQLELLCIEFPSIGITFVDALQNVFDVDGCHIDFTTFKYMLETIFVAALNNFIRNKHIFSCIIFSTEQSQWIDEFFIFNAESALKAPVSRKDELKERLKKVSDENLKILCSHKLQSEKITPEQLLETVGVMKDAHGAYPELVEVDLQKWPSIIKDSQVYFLINSKQVTFKNEKQRKLALFWCCKLAGYFDVDEIVKAYNILGAQKNLDFDEEIMGRLVQRLCNNEIISGKMEAKPSPSKIFACGIPSLPNSSPVPKILEINVSSEDYEIAKEMMKPAPKQKEKSPARSLDDLLNILRKCNESSEAASDACDLLVKKSEDSLLEKIIEQCIDAMSDYDDDEPLDPKTLMENFKKAYYDSIKDSIDFDLFLLKIVDEIICKKRGFYLRNNQRIAVLCAVKSKKGILQQLATGEGKSLIVTAVSIISVLKGNGVNIVTSSPTLAKRDTESPAPVGCMDIYEAFGIKASHICVDSPTIRTERYASNQIIYGDLTSFQRDYLLDTFYSMNIVGSRGFGVVIVDEVDSMLLDQGSNMLYLSHEIPDLEMLQSLFVKIWQIVNGFLGKENGAFDNENVYQAVYRNIFPLFLMQHFADMLGISENEAGFFKDVLLKQKIISNEGEVLIIEKICLIEKLNEIQDVPKSTITRFIYAYDRLMQEQRLDIPQHLHEYVKRHLKEFISNAKGALFIEEGVGYQVDTVRSNVALSFQPKIIIIDQGTGVDLPTTQWSNGLHQFLQLKHGLRLTAVSMKAVFTSNVSYLKKYGKIYGFSGTLGAAAERKQLSNMYDLECIALPSSLPKLFYEEPSVVSTVKDCDEENSHVSQIFNVLNEKMNEGRSVLVICESIKQVTELSEKVKFVAQQKLSKENSKPFEDALLYRRDQEKFIYGDGTALLEPRKIIYSTNLAGRGTDIKLNDKLRSNGGLHVIVAFLPDNLRVEEQAFGRAARCGDRGTAQLVIYADEEENGKIANISKLKLKRNAQEIRRIQKITEYYKDKLLVEEKCFKHFSEQFKLRRKALDLLNINEERHKLASRDLLDQWALWLDKSGHEGLTGDARITAAEEFCQKLAFVNEQLNLTLPLNVLKYGILEAYDSNYDHAEKLFNWIIKNYPVYLPEAKYYLTFVYVKKHGNMTQSKTQDYKRIENFFEEARNGFEKRLFGYYNDRAIIEHYKKNEEDRIFKTDAFSQQQLELAQLMNLFIESIDVLLGGRIDSRDFMTELVNEEASYLLHKHFSDSNNFKNPPITETKVRDNFEKRKLVEYCQKRGISSEAVFKKIKGFKNGIINESELIESMNPATAEEFWKQLIKNNLVVNEKKHVFVDITKYSTLNTELAKIIQELEIKQDVDEKAVFSKKCDNHQIFEYSFVLEEKWKELNFIKTEERLRPECIKTLMEIGAICYTKSGELLEKTKKDISNITFEKFSKVAKNDLILYGIPEAELDNILQILVETKFLEMKNSNIYELSPLPDVKDSEETNEASVENPNKTEHPIALKAETKQLPNCFDPVIEGILNQKLAYSITYRNLQQKLKENEELTITLPTMKETSSIFDLIDLGVLQKSNVNFKGLNENAKNTNIIMKGYNYLMDNEASHNVSSAAKQVSKICEKNLTAREKKTKVEKGITGFLKKVDKFMTQPTFGETGPQIYKEMTNSVALSQFQNIFVQKSPAIQRIETLDVKLISLWDKLSECNLIELRSTCLMVTHGPTHLISLHEQKWSLWTMGKLGIVALAAAAQLAVGGVILVCSAGSGAFVANFFISEGISDFIYVIKGACSGYTDNYKQHKMMSMLASGILCGVGGYFASGSQFNTVAHGIYAPGWATQGIKHIAYKGSALVAKAGFWKVFKETAKQIARRLGSAVLNLALFAALQQALKAAIDYAITSTRKQIVGKVDDVFNGLGSLRSLLKEVYTKLGIDESKRLVNECGKHVLQGKSNDWLSDICDFIFVKYRHLFINFGQGISDGMNHGGGGNATAEKVKIIMKVIPTTFLLIQFTELIKSMYVKITSYMGEIETMIRIQFEARMQVLEREKSNDSTSEDESVVEKDDEKTNKDEPYVVEEATKNVIEAWHKQMGHIVDKTLESRVAMPLLALATSAIQRKLEAMVARGYAAFMEKLDKDKMNQYKKEFEDVKNSGANEEIVKVARKDYETKLVQLQKDTRSPEVYAKILIEGVKIDQTGASAIANMASAILGQPVIVNVKNQNGEVFTHQYGEGNQEAKVIEINLANQHYGNSENTNSGNSCLYEELCKQIPEMKQMFSDDDAFRHELANVITDDPYFRQHIQNGWHSIAIEKGLIGGNIQNSQTGSGTPRSKSAKRHTLAPTVINEYSDPEEYSESCEEPFVTQFQNLVERPSTIQRIKNGITVINTKGEPRTTFAIDSDKFDQGIKAAFDEAFDKLMSVNPALRESDRSTYKMNIQISGNVKAYEHTSTQGKLSGPQDVTVKDPTFAVKGGLAMHYAHDKTNKNTTSRISTKDGGPRTYYQQDNLKYERVP